VGKPCNMYRLRGNLIVIIEFSLQIVNITGVLYNIQNKGFTCDSYSTFSLMLQKERCNLEIPVNICSAHLPFQKPHRLAHLLNYNLKLFIKGAKILEISLRRKYIMRGTLLPLIVGLVSAQKIEPRGTYLFLSFYWHNLCLLFH